MAFYDVMLRRRKHAIDRHVRVSVPLMKARALSPDMYWYIRSPQPKQRVSITLDGGRSSLYATKMIPIAKLSYEHDNVNYKYTSSYKKKHTVHYQLKHTEKRKDPVDYQLKC